MTNAGRNQRSPLSGMAQTVLGPISPDGLGVTMTHEHLFEDLGMLAAQPTTDEEKAHTWEPITLQNINWVRYHPGIVADNMRQTDVDIAIEEALLFKKAGGNTIVDVTCVDFGRAPQALVRVARATGLNVIMATGYYITRTHPADMDERTEDDLAAEFKRELLEGVGDTGIKAGIMKLGNSWPMHPNERKVLRAGGMVQREIGAPITIHPGRPDPANEAAHLLDIVGVLTEAGADASQIIMGHIETRATSHEALKKVAETGCFIEYDVFGRQISTPQKPPVAPSFSMPSDGQRLDQIAWLIAEGHREQMVVSHDCGYKESLVHWGGYGYAHILENVVPLMRHRGFKEEDIQAILVDNPKRALTFL